MSLKKYLKTGMVNAGGQVVIEYFILLVLIATLTIIGAANLFWGKAQRGTETYVNAAVNKMAPCLDNCPSSSAPAPRIGITGTGGQQVTLP